MSEQQGSGSTRRDFIRNATAAAVARTVASRFDGLGVRTRRAATRSGSAWSAAAAAAPAPSATCSKPPRRSHRRASATPSRTGSTSAATPLATRTSPTRQPSRRTACFVGLDAYKKVLDDRRQLRDPGDAAGLPADAHQGGDRGRQEHLHREAGGGGRRPASAACSAWPTRSRSRRTSRSSPARSAGTRPATSRR